MKTTAEVWLETVKDALARGEAAVLAVSKANIVTNSYGMRFVPDKEFGPATVEQAKAHFEELLKEGKIPEVDKVLEKYEKPELPIPTPGYIAGDPNAR